MTLIDTYYHLKPFIPRRLQIALRRMRARRMLRTVQEVWPINQDKRCGPKDFGEWPGRKKFALVLNHDVDTAKGHAQCLRLMAIEKQMDFRSSFYFVPEGYYVSPQIRRQITEAGFEVGVHGLVHDGKIFRSRRIFCQRALRINRYLHEWNAVGFSSPSMLSNLDWITELDIEYDISTFDTDPFEPQPCGVGTIHPFWNANASGTRGNVELPCTLPQDHTLFIILKETDIAIWKRKLDWIADKRGLALLITHPDYMNFGPGKCAFEEYPLQFYTDFLDYVRTAYGGRYWNPLSREMARFWRDRTLTSGNSFEAEVAGPGNPCGELPGDEAPVSIDADRK